MLSDHISDSILGKFSFLNLIGRISFPIFAFQTAQGYIHTKNLKKYIIKLLIFACISQIPFMLFLSTFTTNIYFNVLFTFLLGVCALYIYDKCNNKILGFLFVIIISIIAYFIKVDYGAFGILLIFVFYFFYNNKNIKYSKLLMSICVVLLGFIKYLPDILNTPSLTLYYLALAIFTCLSFIFILFYNNKEGPKLKYFFYIFYPLHLLILYLINIFI